MLLPVAIPPGVYSIGTDYDGKGRWRDMNLTRFEGKSVVPVGGWSVRSDAAATGMVRAMIAWTDNSSQRWVALGSSSKLYIMGPAGDLYDVTPATLTAGDDDATFSGGYGMGGYGDDDYGTPREDDDAIIQPATVWTFGIFDDVLIGCAGGHDGKAWEWDGNTAADAVAVTNAPTDLNAVVVTPDGFLIGIRDRNIVWSAQGVRTVWTPSSTNEAGDKDLQTRGSFLAGKVVRGGVLILSTVDAFLMRYIGKPFIFGFDRVGDDCGLPSPSSVVQTDRFCAWMGSSSFHIFYGQSVQVLPCDVTEAVFDDDDTGLNVSQASKISAFHNAQHNEVWWFYPSKLGTECDRYVWWNYVRNIWGFGALARTAGIGPGTFDTPLLIGTDGVVYNHETGFERDGVDPYIRSAPIELGNGDARMLVSSVIPDEKTLGDVTFRIWAKEFPTGDERSWSTVLSENTDLMLTARQVEVELIGERSANWRCGTFRLEVEEVSWR